MKIVNKTRWNTKQLRKIVLRVAQTELEPEHRRKCTLRIVPARQQECCTGEARIKGYWSCVRVPTKIDDFSTIAIEFARVVAHELAHNRGERGERWMRSANSQYGRGDKSRAVFAWAATAEYAVSKRTSLAPLTPQAKALKRAIGNRACVEKRAKRAAELLTTWQRKAKLAATKIRKLKQRVRYYEKKVAAFRPTAELAASEANGGAVLI